MAERGTLTVPDIRHDWRIPVAQARSFLAGAGSISCRDHLLTTPNPSFDADMAMLAGLGLERRAMPRGRTAAESRP